MNMRSLYMREKYGDGPIIIKRSFRCDCLIDQDRYIGSDPVGYACTKPATYENQENWALFCDEHAEMWRTNPDRITLPGLPFQGFENQKRLYEAMGLIVEEKIK